MPTVSVPLFSEVYRNVDETTAKDTSWELINGYRNDLLAINSRPGLSIVGTFNPSKGLAITGTYWWDRSKLLVVTAGEKLSVLSFNGSNFTIVDLTSDALNQSGKTSFASDGTYIFAANGGRIVYTNGTASTAYIADADCPTTVTHIGWLDGYLLALSDDVVYYSDVNDAFTWIATDFFTTPGNPDKAIAMAIWRREIYLFGTSSIEIWENDGETPFSRVPGGFISVGCIAPDSIVETESGLYWLDSNRRFSRFTSRVPEVISSAYDKEIQTFGDVSTCSGFRMLIEGSEFLVWSFPSANRTLVYNPRTQDWYEWGSWDSRTATYSRYLGSVGAICPAWGMVLVGEYSQPYLYVADPEQNTDNGNTIRVSRRSGHISYNTLRNKRSNELRFRLRRGDQGNSYTDPPSVMFRWRDDNRPTWSNEQQISLGAPGQSDIVYKTHRNGVFRTRQYELSFSADAKFILSEAEEDIDILR